jgi:uncharacterized protein YyaL (SSP411 family)
MSLLIELARQGTIPWRLHADPSDPRPQLLVVGTALDHWSSRLVAELNAAPELSGALAELFSCILVDAAQEPQLAALGQHALRLTNGEAGYPVLAVCTPHGQPFGALPWRPIGDLATRLLAAAEAWHLQRADCLADAARIARAWEALRQPASGKALQTTLVVDAAEAAAIAAADPLEGGFGPPPRLVEPALWEFLIARAARPDAPFALQAQVERSLTALVAGQLHDHIGGGFFAGCATADWQQPFCHKPLATQAQLALLLLSAGERLGKPLWREIGLRTLDFAVSSLRLEDGSYAHGLHADSPTAPGRWEHGAVYRWTLEQAAAVVGAEGSTLLAERFALPGIPGLGAPLADHRLPALVQRLAVARSERPQPRRDDTVIAAEQGLIACALARAGLFDFMPPLVGDDPWTGRALTAIWRHTGAPDPRALAIAAADVMEEDLDPAGGLAPAAVRAQLCLDLAELTGDPNWRARAQALIDRSRDRIRAAPLAAAGLLTCSERLG